MFSMQQLRERLEAANQVPLLVNNPPSTIWYSDKPPMLGGIPRRISIAEFMQIYVAKGGEPFEYTETIWYAPTKRQEAKLNDRAKSYEEHRPKFESFLSAPAQLTDRLMISFINPAVGFGVFANEDIPALSMLGIYSGVFMQVDGTPYAMGDQSIPCRWGIDAQQKGGITRFFQHMPTSLTCYYEYYCTLKKNKEVNDFFVSPFAGSILNEPLLSFDDFFKQYKESRHINVFPFLVNEPSIASQNVGHTFYIMDGLPLFIFYSCQKINRHEQLGFNYSKGYWTQIMKGAIPCLFNMQGEIIGKSHTCQKCNFTTLKLLTCAGCGQVYYCNAQCQKEDWKEHKKQCKK